MYDVDDISRILKVSNRTVYRYLSKHNDKVSRHLSKGVNGKKLLDHKGLEVLARLTNKEISIENEITQDEEPQERNDEYIELLKEQVKDLKKDKQRLNNRVDELTRLLDQQQQLTLIGSPENNKKSENESSKNDSEKKGFISKIKELFK